MVTEVAGTGDTAASVLDAGREDFFNGRGGAADVQYCNRIVFLQRYPGRFAVGADGDSFGFDVLGQSCGNPQPRANADSTVDQFGSSILLGAEIDTHYI